jgi:predicted methyltransferase
MYDQSKLSELIRFAGVDAGSTVIDVYPGDGDWTRLFSDVVGPHISQIRHTTAGAFRSREPTTS